LGLVAAARAGSGSDYAALTHPRHLVGGPHAVHPREDQAAQLEPFPFRLNRNGGSSLLFDAFSSREPVPTPGSSPRTCFARKRSKPPCVAAS
jgi:hypothetical protein